MRSQAYYVLGLTGLLWSSAIIDSNLINSKPASAVSKISEVQQQRFTQNILAQQPKPKSTRRSGLPKVAPGVTLTTLHRFCSQSGEGSMPYAGLTYLDNAFYGTTDSGGRGAGTVFKFSLNGNVLTTLYSFPLVLGGPVNDGASPRARLIVDRKNKILYGTTFRGGLSTFNTAGGAVFKISTGGTYNYIYGFGGPDQGGLEIRSPLLRDKAGNLFGTAFIGGTNNLGTIFKISANGSFKRLHSFNGTDGANPVAGLTRGLDGNFYGVTQKGGTNDAGTIFRITPAGVFTSFYSFKVTDGISPSAEFVRDRDGNGYSTTQKGGSGGLGTVFRLSASGQLTTLHHFSGTDGSGPIARLVRDSVGNIFGTTNRGGANDGGTVFHISPSGQFTSLYSFSFTGDNAFPNGLTLYKGVLYGTTRGDVSSCGTIFSLSISATAPIRRNSPKPMLVPSDLE